MDFQMARSGFKPGFIIMILIRIRLRNNDIFPDLVILEYHIRINKNSLDPGPENDQDSDKVKRSII